MSVYIITGLYFALLIWIGILGKLKGTSEAEDYILAGRNQGWIVTSFTMMATLFSAYALMGMPALIYKHGLVILTLMNAIPLAGLIVLVFGLKIHAEGKKHGFVTPSDLIGHYYPSKFLNVMICIVSFLYVLPYIILQIKAGGYLFETLTNGEVNQKYGAIIIALMSVLYLHLGGMRSVAWTDVIQGIMLVLGMAFGGFITWKLITVNGSFFSQALSLGENYFTIPGAAGYFTIPMLLSFSIILSVGSMLNPPQWLRYNSAQSSDTLKRSAYMIAIVLTVAYLGGTIFIGLGGKLLYPELARADQVFISIIKDNLPL